MNKKCFFIAILALVLFSSCEPAKEKSRCKPPPQGFTEADLVGTWWMGHKGSPMVDDTLIIRKNGTYKQIIYLEYAYIPDVNYESDWLSWHIEQSDDDIPYLHMEDLRLCAHAPDLRGCDQIGGGDYDWEAFNAGEWYDYCHDKWMVQKNEGILLVNGAVYDGWTDEGVELTSLAVSSLDSWVYRLQRPELLLPTPP